MMALVYGEGFDLFEWKINLYTLGNGYIGTLMGRHGLIRPWGEWDWVEVHSGSDVALPHQPGAHSARPA